jgi:hypothetical protein
MPICLQSIKICPHYDAGNCLSPSSCAHQAADMKNKGAIYVPGPNEKPTGNCETCALRRSRISKWRGVKLESGKCINPKGICWRC